jgi:hypothetical protein
MVGNLVIINDITGKRERPLFILISTFLLVLNANEKCFNGDIEGI